MTLQIGDISCDTPVFLAPMAGITDVPFRALVAGYGAGLVVSEMVASQEMLTERPSARAKAELGLNHLKTSVQIAGREPHWMAECARMIADMGARIIDINMGCPAKKVTSGLSGSALMREPERAVSLIRAVVDAVSVPVTLKMRLGWDDASHNAAEIARIAEDLGVRMITVHGRTRCQFYKGHADWRAIAPVKAAVSVPVIANGDIVCASSARAALEQSGADGVMVGRGARGQPWLLSQIEAELSGKPVPPAAHGPALATVMREHYRAMLAFYGEPLGARCARKHLGWYCDRANASKPFRQALLTEPSPDRVLALLQEFPANNLAVAAE